MSATRGRPDARHGGAGGRALHHCIDGFGAGDSARVAAQVVTGVGFLVAGAILHMRGSVHDLTTAASLWVTAAIGVSVGVGMILMSLETAVVVFFVLGFGPRPQPKTGRGESE